MSYNKAVKYLRKKYGEKALCDKFNHLIKCDLIGVNTLDKGLHLLMQQSYLSIRAKKELNNYWKTNFGINE